VGRAPRRSVRQVALTPLAGMITVHSPSREEEPMSRDPNDDRSDSMNPNNDAYWDSLDNHSNQLNPNNDEYQGPETDDDDE